jgi:peptidoglycan hydrolase CwlO-like protein
VRRERAVSAEAWVTRFETRQLLRVAGALAVGCLLWATPLAGFAAPAGLTSRETSSGTPATIKAKEGEQKIALAELERMRVRLAEEVGTYVSTGRRIQQARKDIAAATAEIDEQERTLAEAQEELTRRVIELYRSDRLSLLKLILTADTVQSLVDRLGYLAAAGRHDLALIKRVQVERQEALWLQQTLSERVDLLTELQNDADRQRKRIETEMAAQQKRANDLGEDIARLLREEAARVAASARGSVGDAQFNPDMLISQERFRLSTSMNVADIQAFLDEQPGSLKYYRAADHAGRSRSAAEMIAEAAVAWQVSPEVLLVTLQKEQSLLSRANPTQRALDWALGVGKTDSRTLSQYRGFGNQIWYGAKTLDTGADRWKPGTKLTIDGNAVMPFNGGTFALYRYTPHIHGNLSFWMLYWRYFGDPLSVPAIQ